MKTLIKVFVGFIVALGLGIAALTMLVPVEKYKEKVLAVLEEKTGRKVTIDGKISLSVFPDIALKTERVTVSNPPWAGGGDMVVMDGLRVGVRLMPLLHKEIILNGITLAKPQILLVQNGKQVNWQLDKQAAPASAQTVAPPASKGAGFNINLGNISIEHGDITVQDLAKHTQTVMSDVNFSLAAGDLKSALTVKGDFMLNNMKHEINAKVEKLSDLQTASTGFDASWKSGNMSAAVKGTVSLAHGVDVNGELTADVSGIRALAHQSDKNVPDHVALKGNLVVSKPADVTTVDLKGANIKLDDRTFEGRVGARIGAAVPYIIANLQTVSLDFGNEGSGVAPAGGEKSAPSAAAPAATSNDWSDARIDLSTLGKVNADIALSIGKLRFKQAIITPAKLLLTLKDGALSAHLQQAGVYSGKADVAVKATTGGAFAVDFSMSGIQAEPLLHDWASYDKLQGTISGTLHVTTGGLSQRQMVSHLNGTGSFKVTNGVYKGKNVINIVRNVTGAIRSDTASDDKTTFTDLSANITIANGVVSNKDLVMHSSLMGLSGAGTVDLPAQRINYTVKPVLQTATDKGIAVPVNITGSLHNPQWAPDLKAILSDPAALQATIHDAVKNFKSNSANKKDTVKNLKGLLGSFR